MNRKQPGSVERAIEEELGLRLSGDRGEAWRRALRDVAASMAVSERELCEKASMDGALRRNLIERIIVPESYFFRDHTPLRQALLAMRDRHEIHVWVAGCARGEEAYSVLLLAHEELGERQAERVHVVATDLSPDLVERAREGGYREWSLRATDAERRERWFSRTSSGLWQLAPSLLGRVSFSVSNLLAGPASGGPFDIVLCRNVLIYFHSEAICRATEALVAGMHPESLLITGPSDPLLEHSNLERKTHLYRYSPVKLPPVAAALQTEPKERRPVTIPPTAELKRELHDRDYKGGLQELDRALAEAPFNAELYTLRAEFHRSQGNHNGALNDARRALMLDSNEVRALLISAISMKKIGKTVEAERFLRRAERALDRVTGAHRDRSTGKSRRLLDDVRELQQRFDSC